MALARVVSAVAFLAAGWFPWLCPGQSTPAWRPPVHSPSGIVVPQVRGYRIAGVGESLGVMSVRAHARIQDQVAATTLEVSVKNPCSVDQEAVLVLPVPEGATVSAFEFAGSAAEARAEVLPREVARAYYREIVAQLRDPALLEFAGHRLIRSSVFPVPAHGEQRVRLRYEHLLEPVDGRLDYVLPRSESLASHAPWEISAEIISSSPIATVYSPSHPIQPVRHGDHRLTIALDSRALQPGPFRLAILRETNGIAASLFAYPDPLAGGGMFLLVAGLPVPREHSAAPLARELVLVLDRSGSMAGAKMDQARAAAARLIEQLAPGDSFNIIDFSTGVDRFAPAPVPRTDQSVGAACAHVMRLCPTGGTNIHDALLEALRQPCTPGALPLVLLLTDGLPTIGRTAEAEIRALVTRANPHQRRVFTLGVGGDVNVPLLDAIAEDTRAASSIVLEDDELGPAVAALSRRLSGPLLTGAELSALDARGNPAPAALRDVLPAKLPDLFQGDQLVVLGRYLGEEPLRFQLSGRFRGEPRQFRFDFGLEKASTRNAFVARLWASRQIATLADRIRQQGVDPRAVAAGDAKVGELVSEIVRLSAQYGVLSEYTAFLAREGTDLTNREWATGVCHDELLRKAVQVRSGVAAVTQGWNFQAAKSQSCLNFANRYVGADLVPVEVANVQQIHDRCFYQQGARWVEARLATRAGGPQPAETVSFGSGRFFELLDELVASGRAGLLSLKGEIVVEIEGKEVLVQNPQE